MSESPKNIIELLAALDRLKGKVLSDERELYDECRNVFEKLKRLSDFDPSDVNKIIEILDKLPPEIKELDINRLDVEAKEMESKALNKEDLKQLLDDYEKSQDINKKEKIAKEITKRTGEKNVEQFIKTQKENARKNQKTEIRNEKPETREKKIETKKTIKELVEDYKKAEVGIKKEIEKKIYFETGEKNTEKYIKKIEEVETRNKNELEKFSPDLKEKITQDLVKISENQPEIIVKIIEKASLEEKFNKKKLQKEIKKNIKDAEKIEIIVQKIEEVRAEILVESKAEEIAKTTYEKLKIENIPVSEEIKSTLKEEILRSWKEGDELKIPEELKGIEHGEIVVREAVKAVENFKSENLEAVVNYRAIELQKEIKPELRKNGVEDEILIEEYVSVINKLNNNPEKIIAETNRGEIANFVESKNPNKSPGQIEASIDEAQFMAKNVVMAPKKFNKYIGRYNQIREKIGAEKLPKLKEIRVTEKMAAIFKNNPGMLKLMNGAQRMVGVWEKINAFPGNLIGRIGGKVVEKFGGKVLEKIGGQAAVELVKNAAAVIAKEGTIQGIKSIALGIMGKGAVVAGSGAAGGGALAGAIAAFQALPVVGQVIAVVAAAIMLLKPVVDGAKKLLSKITGMDANGVKNFLSDTLGLGKVVGSVGQFAADVGTFLVGIPALIGLINFGAIVTPVVIFFLLGSFTYSVFQHNLISSIVPPDDTGGGGEIPTVGPWPSGTLPFPSIGPWPSGAPVPIGCPGGRPTSGYFTQGPFALGCSHSQMSVPAIDIGTGEGTPIVATHPGIAVLGYDTIYGYYIDVHGNCEGKEFYTRYAHMPSGGFKVENNASVVAGQQIGVVDNTGSSTGNHLHYHIVGLEVSKFGQYLGLSPEQAQQLWGCCGSYNGKWCP